MTVFVVEGVCVLWSGGLCEFMDDRSAVCERDERMLF